MENWKRQLTHQADVQTSDQDPNSPEVLRVRQEQAYRSVGALQFRVEELTLEVTKLLEERDTLQLKLSNSMRQFERQKESVSRASTAASTPIPWASAATAASDVSITEVRELKAKIDELKA